MRNRLFSYASHLWSCALHLASEPPMLAPGYRSLKWGLILVVVMWLAVGTPVQVVADGPLVPGYLVRDGQRVPAPTGYIQSSVISGEGQECGPFVNPQDLFLHPPTGNLLVADTGNNRVVILDGDGKCQYEIGGQGVGLNEPEGLFVDAQGDIWVADTGNARVMQFAPDGTLKAEYGRPESDLLLEYDFRPTKIVVDKRGFIYTVIGSEGNLGVLVMDATERFRGFFGRTRVKFNLARVLARMFATKAQRRRILRVRPAPMSNIHIDELGFIYAVSPVLTKDQIQRLNSVGENVYGEIGLRTGAGRWWDKLRGKEGLPFGEEETRWRWDGVREMSVPFAVGSMFVDVAVDDLGIVSALGNIYFVLIFVLVILVFVLVNRLTLERQSAALDILERRRQVLYDATAGRSRGGAGRHALSRHVGYWRDHDVGAAGRAPLVDPVHIHSAIFRGEYRAYWSNRVGKTSYITSWPEAVHLDRRTGRKQRREQSEDRPV